MIDDSPVKTSLLLCSLFLTVWMVLEMVISLEVSNVGMDESSKLRRVDA